MPVWQIHVTRKTELLRISIKNICHRWQHKTWDIWTSHSINPHWAPNLCWQVRSSHCSVYMTLLNFDSMAGPCILVQTLPKTISSCFITSILKVVSNSATVSYIGVWWMQRTWRFKRSSPKGKREPPSHWGQTQTTESPSQSSLFLTQTVWRSQISEGFCLARSCVLEPGFFRECCDGP